MAEGPPEPLKEPERIEVDHTDPLDPAHFRAFEHTALELIRDHDRVMELYRDPRRDDPTWSKRRSDMAHAMQEQIAYIHLLQKELEVKQKFTVLYRQLPMLDLKNVQAYEKATEEEVKIQDIIEGATDLYNQLKQRYS